MNTKERILHFIYYYMFKFVIFVKLHCFRNPATCLQANTVVCLFRPLCI